MNKVYDHPSHYESTKPVEDEVYDTIESDGEYDTISESQDHYTGLQSQEPQQPAIHDPKYAGVYLHLVSDSPCVPRKEVHGKPTHPSDESTKSPTMNDNIPESRDHYTGLQSEQPATHEHEDASAYSGLVNDSPSVPNKEVLGELTRLSNDCTKPPTTRDT